MKMTELAKRAGVSVSTVSKAFSGSREISKEKREHIFKVAKATGCYDKYCKDVYNGTVIAVICPEYKSGIYSQQLSILESKIKEKNAIMIVGSTEFEEKREEELLTFFSEHSKVDGIISLTQTKSKKKISVPVVTLGNSDIYDCVLVSEENAVYEAIALLKNNGHKDIAFIGEPRTTARCKNFETAMKKNRLAVKKEYIVQDEFRFEQAGYNAMNKLLELEKRPTAVIAAYDNIAIGAAKSILEHGLKVPDDISLIGSDNNLGITYLDVPLTSITAYNEDLCDIIVELLFERIKQPGEHKKIKILRELIIRESVGKAPLNNRETNYEY